MRFPARVADGRARRLGLLAAMVALLGGCANTPSASEPTRPAGLTIGVGGSVGTMGAAVSQPRGIYAAPR